MIISINDQQREFAQNQSLAEVLQALDLLSAKGIAIAVNNQIVHRSDWVTHVLSDNDNLTIIKATQGG